MFVKRSGIGYLIPLSMHVLCMAISAEGSLPILSSRISYNPALKTCIFLKRHMGQRHRILGDV